MNTDRQYACGVDIGGTFTDCTLVSQDGDVHIGKVPSTPSDNFRSGFFDSIEAAGRKAGEEPSTIYENLTRITHGTTIATNAIVEGEDADVALLTTKGHEDTLEMMRGIGRATGESPANVFKVADVPKPEPLLPHSRIRGIEERVDSDGNVVVSLDEAAVRDAVAEMADAHDLDALAVSYLWSFQNTEHERRTREIIRDELGDDVFVTLSHEVAPSVGEYERTTATVINSMVGPLIERYLGDIEPVLRDDYGFDGSFLLMGCNGGALTLGRSIDRPIMLIGSGPVGGLNASQQMADAEGMPNVLATDMGGTSFELGMISDGRPLVQERTTLRKYFYDIPKLDVKSIGAGGGSIASVDRGELDIGPQSAGSEPGPACYGRGGTEPTVTDADLLLGFIDPDAEFGTEALQPDPSLAEDAIGDVASELGQTPIETAAAIYQITNAKMANLIEQEVIGRGYDPRDYHVISYGGAGPIHAAAYGHQLDTKSVIVPGRISPVLSAYGILNSDIRQELEQQFVAFEPFDADRLAEAFAALRDRGRELLSEEGLSEDEISFDQYALMRFEGQYNDLEIPIPGSSIDEQTTDALVDQFKETYSERYSSAAVFPEARLEIGSLRVQPIAEVDKFERASAPDTTTGIPSAAKAGTRAVYWPSRQQRVTTQIYDGTAVPPGNEIDGPTVLDLPNTSIVVPEGQRIRRNRYNDFVITNGGN